MRISTLIFSVLAIVIIVGPVLTCVEVPMSAREVRGPDGTIIRTPLDYSGQPHGVEIRFHPDGSVHVKTQYYHGEAVEITQYWPSGRPHYISRRDGSDQFIRQEFPDVESPQGLPSASHGDSP